MNDFVEQCRREWKRLRVPNAVADEMAAELTADLEQAEAEGVPAEEVLGGAVSDPRAFAAAWAAERGAGSARAGERVARRAAVAAAGAALAAVAVSGAVLMIVAATSSAPAQQAVVLPTPQQAAQQANAVWVTVNSEKNGSTFTIEPPRFAAGPVTAESSDDTRTVGLLLLIVGLAGMLAAILVWLLERARQPRTAP